MAPSPDLTASPPRVALTGGAGAVGLVLRPGLLAAGHRLRSHDIRPLTAAAPDEQLVLGDLRLAGIVDRVLEGTGVVVHLAGTSVERPLDEIIENNLRALAALFEGARRHGVRRVVFASSNHAFGMHEAGRMLGLEAPFRPDGLYGLSKAWGEAMARLYWDKHGIESVSLRIGSALPAPTERRHLSTWLGHRDLLALVRRAIEVPAVGCLAVWGVSNNRRRWWDNAGAERLGYQPVEDAEDFAAAIEVAAPPADPVAARFQGGSFAAHDYTRTADES